MDFREKLKDKKRIIIKIGSSSLTYASTGLVNLSKLEKLVRAITDLSNKGKEVVLVSSGAIAVGKSRIGIQNKDVSLPVKQACAAIGQAQLMTMYQKLFAEYNKVAAQILITKYTMTNQVSRTNARNTFDEIFSLGAIPIVNENDTVSTYEIEFGDNDRLSAMVTAIIEGDLLILLSDIDGLYTDDPYTNKDAKFIDYVSEVTDDLFSMGKSSSNSNLGTGGMLAKLAAAKIATASGADMVIANGEKVEVIEQIINGDKVGTFFLANKIEDFSIIDFLTN